MLKSFEKNSKKLVKIPENIQKKSPGKTSTK